MYALQEKAASEDALCSLRVKFQEMVAGTARVDEDRCKVLATKDDEIAALATEASSLSTQLVQLTAELQTVQQQHTAAEQQLIIVEAIAAERTQAGQAMEAELATAHASVQTLTQVWRLF